MKFQGRILIAIFVFFGLATQVQAKDSDIIPGEFLVQVKNLKSETMKTFGFENSVVSKDLNILLVRRPLIESNQYSMDLLASAPNVVHVEPNRIVKLLKTPNDPMLGDLWGLTNSGKSGNAGVDIDAPKAWDITTGSKKVVVAVIDTGVDYTIPDLAPNIWTNEAELNGTSGVDDDNNGFVDDIHGYDFANNDGDPRDDHGHGSHCSGTIGAKGDDGVGIVGVNWNVSIMAVKFLTKSGSGTLEGAIKGINYAVDMGANILSNSWGGGPKSALLKEAIERANQKGVLFVAAAGNNGEDSDTKPMYPAAYTSDNIISVAAVDSFGELAYFSNYGSKSVDIAAPGQDILSTVPGGFATWSGTSMATPHVSGVAALVLAHEPTLTHLELKKKILDGARPLQALDHKILSGGLLNAYNSLTD